MFGSIATLIGCVGSYLLRKHKWLVPLPPIIANVIILPWVLQTAYGMTDAYWYLTVSYTHLILAAAVTVVLSRKKKQK